jgi:hypothetical protein
VDAFYNTINRKTPKHRDEIGIATSRDPSHSMFNQSTIGGLVLLKNKIMENFAVWKQLKENNGTTEEFRLIHSCFKLRCICCEEELYFSYDGLNPIKTLNGHHPHTICPKYKLDEN